MSRARIPKTFFAAPASARAAASTCTPAGTPADTPADTPSRALCTRSLFLLAVAIAGLLPGVGCNNKLETGYDPVRLGATPAQRRSFYAAPFSPESRAAPTGDDALDARRPRPGY